MGIFVYMNNKKRDKIKVGRNAVYHESAGGYVFCEENGKLFVALLKNKDGKYFIPKGHLKLGESPEKAALREIKEELCLDISPFKIAKVGFIEYAFNKNNDNKSHFKKLHHYVFELDKKLDIKPLQDEDCIEARWFEAKDAIQKLEYEKDTLREAIRIFQGYRLVSNHLKNIINRLKKALGNNLVVVVDSGSISSGGYRPGWNDIDLLIVVKNLSLDAKLKIAEELHKLHDKLEIDIGLNVITENEFISPNFPDIRLAGKTLQAMVELSRQPERLIYSSKKVKAFVPNKQQIKSFSLSNISYFVLLNRRELTSVSVTDSTKFKAIVGKQIKYALIITKLALQYHKNMVYDTKQNTLSAARLYFKDFDFNPIDKALKTTKNWHLDKNLKELNETLKTTNDFIEDFSNYIFSRIK